MTQTNETPDVQLQLQLQDVASALQIISLASTRGAFRAEEYSQIGSVYDRISAFIQANTSAVAQPTPPVDAPSA